MKRTGAQSSFGMNNGTMVADPEGFITSAIETTKASTFSHDGECKDQTLVHRTKTNLDD
jgi:hypothetical protein